MADPQAVVDAIGAGDYDSDLGLLFEAMFVRAAETGTGFGWRIRLADDDEFTQETVTLQELAFAERAVSTSGDKVSYLELDPLRSMDHLVALVVAHYHHVRGLKIPVAFAEARKLTVTDLKDIVSVYEVKGSPKDGGDGSTTS